MGKKTNQVWLHCYNCGEQFLTEVGYYYSSKQICEDCRKGGSKRQVANFDNLDFEIENQTSIQLEFEFDGNLITVKEVK